MNLSFATEFSEAKPGPEPEALSVHEQIVTR